VRKALVVTSMVLVAAGLVLAVGCGGNNGAHRLNSEDLLITGDTQNYEGSQGDLVILAEGGIFRSVVAGQVKDGKYKVLEKENSTWVELTFFNDRGDEDQVENWPISEDEKGNEILTDLQGEEYVLKGTRATLR
jgi:hypothetical protein